MENEPQNNDQLRHEIAQAAESQLSRITGRNALKKQSTILSLLMAEFFNVPMQWGRGTGNCAKSTWTDHWQHEPLITEIMRNLRGTLLSLRTDKAARAVKEASTLIQLAAPDAARTLITLITAPTTPAHQQRLAATSIYKIASATQPEDDESESTFTADDLARIRKQAAAELDEWERHGPTAGGLPN
ncbi:MAG: hypothetical protein KC413_24005 [Anaerolineales bacterium]|nr:hypothetical protein [Anaerolineales bacterium]